MFSAICFSLCFKPTVPIYQKKWPITEKNRNFSQVKHHPISRFLLGKQREAINFLSERLSTLVQTCGFKACYLFFYGITFPCSIQNDTNITFRELKAIYRVFSCFDFFPFSENPLIFFNITDVCCQMFENCNHSNDKYKYVPMGFNCHDSQRNPNPEGKKSSSEKGVFRKPFLILQIKNEAHHLLHSHRGPCLSGSWCL